MAKQIVLIEGRDIEFAEQLTGRIEQAGFMVIRLGKGDELEQHAEILRNPDMLLIDIDRRSSEAIKSLIRVQSEEGDLRYPVIALTDSPSIKELEMVFSAGANDYVSKGVLFDELLIRMNNLIHLFQRLELDDYEYLNYDDLSIEIKQRRVFRAGEEIVLTPKEYDLLLFLARRRNQICSREILLQEVWGYDFTGKTNVVDVYIKHIRAKIDEGRRHKLLHTVRGAGYMLQ